MQQGAYKDYIQHLASPLTIYLWTSETFKVLNANKNILKDASFTVHLDASGESVRQIKCAAKRILTYKMAIRIKNMKKVFTVAEAILSRHTMCEILTFLEKLRLFCKENRFKWPFFERVCTDVSFSLFGAVLSCCNNQDISEYIMSCYQFLKSGDMKQKPKVIVQYCKCHYMHIMCKDLDKQIGRHHILRKLLKGFLKSSYSLKTMEECKQWFKMICIVLLYPVKNKDFNDSFNYLKNNILEDVDDVDDDEKMEENKINDEISNFDSIAMRSRV